MSASLLFIEINLLLTIDLSVSPENVSCVDFFLYIVQTGVVSVGDDSLALGLEGFEIVYDSAAEEGAAIFECRLIDDDLCAFRFDAFHDALDGGLAEVVAVRLHRQPVYADGAFPFLVRRVVAAVVVAIVACLAKHPVGDKVFACSVAFHNGLYEVFRHVVVVGQQLLGVLRQAVASIAERWVVVVVAHTGIKAYAADDGLCVEPFHL